MSPADYILFAFYMVVVLYVGWHFSRKNRTLDDYYVGDRKIPATHVGLSIVATDVGGGFSIGLGGLGFAMGLSGSWLLFTGLVGAWFSAVFLIPRIKRLEKEHNMYTYPDFLRLRYGNNVAGLAAVISAVGYLGFTAAQVLAGAKLCSATIITKAPFGLTPLQFSIYMIAGITVAYTVLGGIKAVIYTDTIQWIILMSGLIFFAIPITVFKIYTEFGPDAFQVLLPAGFFSLKIAPVTFINWMVTIIPIWVIAMTLYQRMFACKNEKEARKAWYIAGLFEYPVMAFSGVFLGICSRCFFPEVDPEMGLPLLLKDVLPVVIVGIVLASYFSAVMSTADSCLMASSGNMVNDIIKRYFYKRLSDKANIRVSQLSTLVIGLLALVIAWRFENVLALILYTYGFMVSGLFIPTLGAYFWKRGTSEGAMAGMLLGGAVNVLLKTGIVSLPQKLNSYGFDAAVYGILCSLAAYTVVSLLTRKKGVVEI